MGSIAALHGGSFLVGDRPTLADLYLAPIFDYFQSTPDSAPILQEQAGLRDWWDKMSSRDSLRNTPFM
jgi:glutathione S-transferase